MNTPIWEKELALDPDKEFLLHGVREGFHLIPPDIHLKPAEQNNYHSATNPHNKNKVESTIHNEILEGNYCFSSHKPLIISALGSVPKPDSDEVRLIHDCSMPKNKGINSYITVDHHKFSTIDDAIKLVKPGYFLAKIDLHHAYRSIPIHPTSYKATGIKWKFSHHNHFTYLFDTRLPFGASSSPSIFHRVTQSVKRMMNRRGFSGILVYLDDFLIVAQTEEECRRAFDTLSKLLLQLGFRLSTHKVTPPTQCLPFLGIEINTTLCTLKVPPKKLNDIKSSIAAFSQKRSASKRQLQQLAGRLNWAAKVVYGGRTFLRRILDLMNTLECSTSKCRLTLEFHRDIQWWSEFLDSFNGQRHFLNELPIVDLQTDSSSVAAGCFFRGDWLYCNFMVDFPAIMSLHINFKETIAVVLAACRWASAWSNHHVIVYTDNMATVSIINKGTTKNIIVMVFLRLLFWLSATYNFRITARHIRGSDNVTADAISRLHEPSSIQTFYNLLCMFMPLHMVANISLLKHMSLASYFLLCFRYFGFSPRHRS